MADEKHAPGAEAFRAAADLIAYLSSLDAEFLRVHAGDIARRIGEVKSWVGGLREKWEQLEEEAKLEELAKTVEWRPSQRGSGEYAPADKVPELLIAAIKRAGGRLALGGHAYVLSRNGRWVQRYARGERQGGG